MSRVRSILPAFVEEWKSSGNVERSLSVTIQVSVTLTMPEINSTACSRNPDN